MILYEDLKEKPPTFIIRDKSFLLKKSDYSLEGIELINNKYSDYKQGSNYQILKRNIDLK